MGRFFTHYWSNSTWRDNREDMDREAFEYSSGNQFRKRGVVEGDTVYAITVTKGDLYLCAKMIVGSVTNKREAARRLGGEPWPASDHLFASEATPMIFNRKVIASIVHKLRFIGGHDSKPAQFDKGKLDKQTLRGVRELDAESASLLDTLLPKLSSVTEKKHLSVDSIGDNGKLKSERAARRGAGFGTSEMNRKVERAAIRFVRNWYASHGWRVDSREKENLGYDLVCIKGDAEEHVEVKGVQGEYPSFPITAGEINYARKNPKSKIIVVISALSKTRQLLRYDWRDFETSFRLDPLAFRASLVQRIDR